MKREAFLVLGVLISLVPVVVVADGVVGKELLPVVFDVPPNMKVYVCGKTVSRLELKWDEGRGAAYINDALLISGDDYLPSEEDVRSNYDKNPYLNYLVESRAYSWREAYIQYRTMRRRLRARLDELMREVDGGRMSRSGFVELANRFLVENEYHHFIDVQKGVSFSGEYPQYTFCGYRNSVHFVPSDSTTVDSRDKDVGLHAVELVEHLRSIREPCIVIISDGGRIIGRGGDNVGELEEQISASIAHRGYVEGPISRFVMDEIIRVALEGEK